MDTDTLVRDRIDDGQKLVEELAQEGFKLTAAFWLKTSDDGKWYFYIVSPEVDAEGLTKAYRLLHRVVRAMSNPFWIDPLEIKLIGRDDPIARDVMVIHGGASGSRMPTWWGGKKLGNVSIEDAYLYPLPATAP